MERWFDDLTRKLASQPLTRRGMVSWSTKVAAAVAGAGIVGRQAAVADAAMIQEEHGAVGLLEAPRGLEMGVRQAASTCKVDDSYGVLRSDFSLSSAGAKVPLTLSHAFVAEVATGTTFSTMTVKAGAEVVRRMTATSLASGRSSATSNHGARYTGAKGVRFTTDGSTVEGIVDNRLTEPGPLTTEPTGLRFKDGKPERPSLLATADLDQSVNDLLRQALAQSIACQPDDKAPKPVTACTVRQLSCREAWVKCSLAAAQSSLSCGPFASLCYVKTAAATCDSALQRCYRDAKSSGACCPDYCKGDAGCCQTAWGCCPPSGQTSVGGQPVSKAWPTCPRCGPVTAADTTPRIPARKPRKPRPEDAPKPIPVR
jgi:hypothetical protein